jgi:hypothetical protein
MADLLRSRGVQVFTPHIIPALDEGQVSSVPEAMDEDGGSDDEVAEPVVRCRE